MMRPLAVLRPEPGNAATAARIEALGLTAIRLPLFEVRPLVWTPPDPGGFDALLLTSANAVRHAGVGLDLLRALPVVAVGEATARAARTARLAIEAVGSGDVASAVRASGGRRLLHLCGRDHVAAAAASVAVYAAEELPVISARPLDGCVVLVHSVRAARRLATLVERDGVKDLRVAAISDAARLAGPDVAGAVADRPDDTALVALAARTAAD
jgi:uroporphyrinogen-III synthase